MTGIWPWPGDTRTDQAQRVARTYRDALLREAPDVCAFLDRQFVDDWRQTWLTVVWNDGVDHDEWLTVDEAAARVGAATKTVFTWIYNGKVQPHRCNDGRVRVQLRDVLDYDGSQRRGRAQRRTRKRAS